MNQIIKKRQQFKTFKEKNIICSQAFKKYPDILMSEADELISLIDYLGYNVNKTDSEYIYTAIDNINSKIKWLKTINQKYKVNKWNIDLKTYYTEDKYFNLYDFIVKHTYPLEIKNKRIYKKAYSGDIEDRQGMHYINNSMCGASLKETSNILILDIDCHNQNTLQTFNTYKCIINKYTPIFVERSYEGSYHLFFKLDRDYSLYEKRKWIEDINKQYNLDIHIPEKMRFPFSYTYCPINIKDDTIDIRELSEIRKDIYNNNNYITLSSEKIKKIHSNNTIPFFSDIYTRQKINNNKFHIKSEELNDIEISKGNRYFNMLKIIRIGKFNGWSIEEIISTIYKLNNPLYPSKDLTKWSYNQLYKQVHSIYDKCNMYYIESFKPNEFISNIQHIPTNILSLIENKKFLTLLINNSGYKNTELNHKKFSIIFKEMIGYYYYNSINPKQIKNKKSDKYLRGIQYSEQYASRLKEFYKEDLSNTNVFGIINSILKKSTLFKQYKWNYKGWYYNALKKENNYCRLFNFTSNSIKKDILNNKNNISFHILKSISNLDSYLTDINNFIYRTFFNEINNIFIAFSLLNNKELTIINTG